LTDNVPAIHTPVLADAVLELLAPRNDDELMIDATLGEGGHSFQFLSRFKKLKIIGIDADPEILKIAGYRLKDFGDRIRLFSGWSYDFFGEYNQERRPDTILIDLGVSLYHYEKSGRGFSFLRDEPLDMRIDPANGNSAAALVNNLPEKELADLLYINAEERFSRRIAGEIVRARTAAAIESSAVLAKIVEHAVPKEYRHGPVHPATRTFLALRIAVNGELSGLETLLENSLKVLKPGGRIGVISFHSLEDRIVKNFFREKARDCICPPGTPICKCRGCPIVDILAKKGITPGPDEIKANPPSRSARLRAAVKIKDE